MWEKTLGQRLALILIVLLIGIFMIYPPKTKLRGGLDIEGGVSMIFEIQEEQGENNPYLAEQMKQLLMKRVDPQGIYGLNWRVMGSNRLEIQMPLPPEDNKRLQNEFVAAREQLLTSNIHRGEMEAALRASGDERTTALAALARGNEQRATLLQEAAQAYDEYRTALTALQDAEAQAGEEPIEAEGEAEAQPAASQPDLSELRIALRNAEEELDDAKDTVLTTNFDDRRFQEILEMPEDNARRTASLKEFKERFPTLTDQIENAVERYTEWRANRVYLESPADLRRLLRGAGVLEFRILAEPSPENPTRYDRYREQLRERGPRPADGDPYQWFQVDNPLAFFNVASPAELENREPQSFDLWVVDKYDDTWYVLAKTGKENGLLHPNTMGAPWRLKAARITRDRSGRPAVSFSLDPIGGSFFSKLTGANVGKQLCIFVDNTAYSSANIQSRISTDGVITGEFSRDKISYLISTLQAGSLPARLKDTPLSERTIGSSLGHENLRHAFQAGVAGVIAVALIMIGYYMVAGAIANVALLLNIVLVLAAMAMLGAKFSLAGIAGVILTIGMTVDANVLIFERMREEKARGASLRMIIKNGYDKAFSTIIDANITTLLICVIIYYVGSEEIKGFGLTLGWGIVTSLFTALFVTRTLFTLLIKYNLIKDIQMLHIIGVPNIDWYSMRRVCGFTSIAVIALGLFLLYERGKDALDVEFRGGVNAEIALRSEVAGNYSDIVISEKLQRIGEEISEQGRQLAQANVTTAPNIPSTYEVSAPGIPATRLAAMITEPLEAANVLLRGGVATTGDEVVTLSGNESATAERLQQIIRDLAQSGEYSIPTAGGNIGHANIGLVTETGEGAESVGRYWNITTTVTNKNLVQEALVAAFGADLQIQPRINYVLHSNGGRPYPITNRRLEACIPGLPAGAGGDVTDYLGGAAMYFDQLNPPQTIATLRDRLTNMRLQPDYQDLPWREFGVFGVTPAGQNDQGEPVYSGIAIAVGDQNIIYDTNPSAWETDLAMPELALAQATFDKEQTLRKVTQFKPQIAAQSQTRASMALLLSWAMIIGYLWIRFGRPVFGVAGVVALIHDVLIALAFVGISGWIGKTFVGDVLLISDFKIDMTIVAAFLTIIGYSINDTIVVFDRIRETRGRMGIVTPQIINDSINQCLSRTLLTSITTFAVLLIMYIAGGSSIRGFNFCMMIGVITGTYSSIAVASPWLMLSFGRKMAHHRPAPAPAGR